MKKVIKFFKRFGKQTLDTVKQYPVTLVTIILAALSAAIMIQFNLDLYEDAWSINNLFNKIFIFFLLSAIGELFVEEITRVRKVGYIIKSVFAFLISGIIVFLIFNSSKHLLGIDIALVHEIAIKIAIVYAVATIGYSVFHMFKRTEDDFEVYATKAFIEIVKTTVIYAILAIGLLIIFLIFNYLIYDTEILIIRIEIFIFGGVYIPMCLKAVSRKNEKPDKFAKGISMYVLLPLLLLGFAIIYIYIVKIFVTNTVPSNVVFYILSFLFVVGLVIWTMAHVLCNVDATLAKVLKYLPYIFVPFLFLQCWSIWVRISDYGVTKGRYLALTLLVFEIVYFVLYIIYHITSKKVLSLTIFVVVILSFIGLLLPGASCEDVVINSQVPRLKKMLIETKQDEKVRVAIRTSYDAIDEAGYKGEKTIKELLTEDQIKKIKDYDDYYEEYESEEDEDDTFVDVSDDISTKTDVSKYRKIVLGGYYTSEGIRKSVDEIGLITIRERSSEDIICKIDISKLVKEVVNNYTNINSENFSLKGRNIYTLDKKRDYYIYSFSVQFDSKSKIVEYLTLDGIVLEKK
ncbi:MAG: DUF4153 domain-containing protein [Eubacterium sp.]|nr:DUF4153 domain-containing protein [Eubacterium sp.]